MRATPVWRKEAAMEFLTAERCFILETYNTSNDETLSIARARVPPGVTTALHAVEGTTERYIIAEGRGRVEVGEMPSAEVGPGDVVVIPPGTQQRIRNLGSTDLIFYCVCTPRFRGENYRALE
jgi:mannose-6-phosphate isomerase-like protein (cupin superfamily)